MVHHHDPDELYKYYCHLCGDLFLRGSFLTKHLRTKHNIHKPASLKRFRFNFNFLYIIFNILKLFDLFVYIDI